MTLEVIYVTRHGFRSNWLVNPSSGEYQAALTSPTGIPADPALTAHGVDQARELAAHLRSLDPPVDNVYSSPYYRCLQTIEPFVRAPRSDSIVDAQPPRRDLTVRAEAGLGEWYGPAPFEHPVPADKGVLQRLFPSLLDPDYESLICPSRRGETVAELHDRVASTMERIVEQCDREGTRAVLICTHAAVVIALGRVLTGNMPEDADTEDFRAYTCGLSVYRRRGSSSSASSPAIRGPRIGGEYANGATVRIGNAPDDGSGGDGQASTDAKARRETDWRGGTGVAAGWQCLINSDCSFLSGGEERGWRFSGDEAFISTHDQDLDAGMALGVVVEGRSEQSRVKKSDPSRL
ncbi:hypothetical protein VTK73DRAFT_960 [Phialemonium thermophilum]|uniref:Transcription factor tau 55 kDa subunit n=1 Tax=Phialemonium thermophilum TaxID=223376 RepID=A0ABR3XCQ6_9PEZI